MGDVYNTLFEMLQYLHSRWYQYCEKLTFRPELVIDRSSPVKQNIGDFVDEEEKILSLFKVIKP